MSCQWVESGADTTAARCLALIARHCPRLIREGGGMLAGECKNNRGRISRAEREEIVSFRRRGWTVAATAEHFGYSHATVSKISRAAGVRADRRTVTPEVRNEIVRLRASGHTLKEIAAAVNFSWQCVAEHLSPRTRA